MKKIFIYAVSCRRRSLDANKISDYLSKNGHEIVYKPEDADIIIFITCAFIDKVTENSLNKVKEFQNYKAELIVAGCLPDIEPEKLAKIFDGKTICTKDLDDIYHLFPENKLKFEDIDDANSLFVNLDENIFIKIIKKFFRNIRWIESIYSRIEDHVLKNLFGENSLTYPVLSKKLFIVRISWGCLGNCSYCSIKKAIGPHKSKPIDQCIKEVRKGLHQGHKSFLLTADDAGAYGLDICSSFPRLLNEIVNLEGEFTICIESLKPVWIVKYFEELEKILMSKKIKYIDCSIQSGSKKILELMNRYSDIEKMAEVILDIKQVNPNLILTTEIIIGFPGETEEDFQKTLSFIKKMKFNAGFVYRFACKTGTEADNMELKNPPEIILRRYEYAKKFLKSEGYKLIYIPKKDFLIFDRKN